MGSPTILLIKALQNHLPLIQNDFHNGNAFKPRDKISLFTKCILFIKKHGERRARDAYQARL